MNQSTVAAPNDVTPMRTPEQVGLVARETRNGALGNALIALVVVWLLFNRQSAIPVLGRAGSAFGFVPGTFMFTLGISIGLTLALRSKVRKGAVAPLALAQAGPGRLLPRNLVLRALTLAVLIELLFVPATFALLTWLAPPTLGLGATLALNVVYFIVLSVVVVPVVAWRALADTA